MPPNATRASLLVQLRDKHNALAWSEFVALHMPLLHKYALKAGLQDSDAADVAQDTISQVLRNIDRFDYQPERGSFRGWLLTITRNVIRKQIKKKPRVAISTGDTAFVELLNQQPADAQEGLDEITQWENEYRERAFQLAAQAVASEFRANTWQAFWQTAVVGKEVHEVAETLGISVGAVYVARSRVIARLREEVARFDDDHSLLGDGN